MNASDRTGAGNGGERPREGLPLRADEPMNDETCVFVLTLAADGRPVPRELVERAEAWADAHPACRAELADFAAMGDALRALPTARPRPGFAERVLAARAEAASGGRVLVLARRMAVAAALLLALTIMVDTSHPRGAVADPDVTPERHGVDAFRPEPFGADDLDAGLRELLPDPVRRGTGRTDGAARAAEDVTEPETGDAEGAAADDEEGR